MTLFNVMPDADRVFHVVREARKDDWKLYSVGRRRTSVLLCVRVVELSFFLKLWAGRSLSAGSWCLKLIDVLVRGSARRFHGVGRRWYNAGFYRNGF